MWGWEAQRKMQPGLFSVDPVRNQIHPAQWKVQRSFLAFLACPVDPFAMDSLTESLSDVIFCSASVLSSIWWKYYLLLFVIQALTFLQLTSSQHLTLFYLSPSLGLSDVKVLCLSSRLQLISYSFMLEMLVLKSFSGMGTLLCLQLMRQNLWM